MVKENSEKVWQLVPALLICAAIFMAVHLFSQRQYPVPSLGGNPSIGGALANTIAVSGDGKVYVAPDMVKLNISASEVANTTKEAQTKVNTKIDQVLSILKENGIEDSDIRTMEISLYPEYDYSSGTSRLRGQRATQRLNVSVRNITPESDSVTKIIDAVTEIDQIQMDSIQFDIEDKTEFYREARKLAYEKAEQKAVELADLSEVRLGKPVSIQDMALDYVMPPVYANYARDAAQGQGGGGAALPAGQLEVTVQVQVMFGIR